MGKTKHHSDKNHCGHDYGGRYKCNKGYCNSYGTYGRDLADIERRQEDKRLCKEQLTDTLPQESKMTSKEIEEAIDKLEVITSTLREQGSTNLLEAVQTQNDILYEVLLTLANERIK